MMFADTATAFERFGIMQLTEQRSAAVDLGKTVISHVTGHLWKKARRRDIAGARYENYPVAVPDPETSRCRAAFDLLATQSFGANSLERDATIRGASVVATTNGADFEIS
jgi:hypothetical protein